MLLSSILPIAPLIPTILFPSLTPAHPLAPNRTISPTLFHSLEELSRIVDISYCVGTSGIRKPFTCASRCHEFPDFELVDTFNTGPLLSDSCGFLALDHWGGNEVGTGEVEVRKRGRIIVAFRGTYSLSNTIVDLSTVPQKYVPYPEVANDRDEDGEGSHDAPRDDRAVRSYLRFLPSILRSSSESKDTHFIPESPPSAARKHECKNCSVHYGFWRSWQNTRPIIVEYLTTLRYRYPEYDLHLVGHSLGGAVAALAGLEFESYGWMPTVTTFGEPKVGNEGLRDYVDGIFGLLADDEKAGEEEIGGRYRRVTHVDDPVPLLPLSEWGYLPHAGEIFIDKAPLQPQLGDIRRCAGDADKGCIAQGEDDTKLERSALEGREHALREGLHSIEQMIMGGGNEALLRKRWGLPQVPARYQIWQLFFAHRDYFWRLGLCVPGGDPMDWGREKYGDGEGSGGVQLREEVDARVEEL